MFIYPMKACDGVINLFKIFLGFTSELLAHLLLITRLFYGCFLTIVVLSVI